MTQIFMLSLLGIFALLGGAIILNVMSNLSKISAATSSLLLDPTAKTVPTTPHKRSRWLLLASFPVLAMALFAGNHFSDDRKKNLLVNAAERLIQENQPALAALGNYGFSENYVAKADRTLNLLENIDKNFPQMLLIQPDTIDGKKLFLAFGRKYFDPAKKGKTDKLAHVYPTTQDERVYFEQVFSGKPTSFKFSTNNDHYQLYFPATVDGKVMLLYFSDFQRYGQLGS